MPVLNSIKDLNQVGQASGQWSFMMLTVQGAVHSVLGLRAGIAASGLQPMLGEWGSQTLSICHIVAQTGNTS